MRYATVFYSSDNLVIENLNLGSLKTVGESGLSACFAESFLITGDLNLSSLETIGDFGLEYAFGDTRISSANLYSLKTIGKEGLAECFAYNSNIKSIYFNSLNANSFGGYTNQFNNMLKGCKNVTVHFPVGLDATIGNWSDVLAGFGGTNTTILYDL